MTVVGVISDTHGLVRPEALAAAFANPKSGLLPSRELPGRPDPDEAPCALARRSVKIDPKGDVFPCPTWPVPLGNLRRQRFAELWRSGPLVERLRALRWRDLHGECTDCDQSGYCNRCAAVALLEHGDELGPAAEACRIADAKERALDLPSRSRRTDRGRLRLRVIG